jgi:hypothetical protein
MPFLLEEAAHHTITCQRARAVPAKPASLSSEPGQNGIPLGVTTPFFVEGAVATDFSDVLFQPNFLLFPEKNHMKMYKNQWVGTIP